MIDSLTSGAYIFCDSAKRGVKLFSPLLIRGASTRWGFSKDIINVFPAAVKNHLSSSLGGAATARPLPPWNTSLILYFLSGQSLRANHGFT